MLKDYKVNLDNTKEKELTERIKMENIYMEFIKSQETGFIRFINYINSVVDSLKQRALISPYIEIRARIKDANSALKKYNTDRVLDDVFGVEIICANENEKITIKEELEKYFKSTRTKKHNKPNGYKAEHENYSLKDNINSEELVKWDLSNIDVPAVECQFKTIEVELNPKASHHDYKEVNKEEVQKLLESKTLAIRREIPKMWVSRENGMIELSYKEIIQRVYPFVDITKIKVLEEDVKTK